MITIQKEYQSLRPWSTHDATVPPRRCIGHLRPGCRKFGARHAESTRIGNPGRVHGPARRSFAPLLSACRVNAPWLRSLDQRGCGARSFVRCPWQWHALHGWCSPTQRISRSARRRSGGYSNTSGTADTASPPAAIAGFHAQHPGEHIARLALICPADISSSVIYILDF
jgi:hypothetical protein